jgi:hypothetical protein
MQCGPCDGISRFRRRDRRVSASLLRKAKERKSPGNHKRGAGQLKNTATRKGDRVNKETVCSSSSGPSSPRREEAKASTST